MKTKLIAALVAATTLVCGASAAPKNYLRFTARGGSVAIGMAKHNASSTSPVASLTLEWTDDPDAETWKLLDAGSTSVALEKDETAYFRQHDPERKGLSNEGNYAGWHFTMTADGASPSATVEAGGNCLSLIDATCESGVVGTNGLAYLFYNCKILTTPPELPATQVGKGAFNRMFMACGMLTRPPELPATCLETSCYSYMFAGCGNLAYAPALPAKELATACYNYMFDDCSSLKTPPELPAKVLASSCYAGMFKGCTALESAPALPATKLVKSCYDSMFCECAALEVGPELPATELAEGCYYSMFSNCSSLKTAPALSATTLYRECYKFMFYECSSLVFAPHLPATKLAEECYVSMFYRCAKLKRVSVGFTTWQTDGNQTAGWLAGVSSSGTFIKPSALASSFDAAKIPTGWTTKTPVTAKVPVTDGLISVATVDGQTIYPTRDPSGSTDTYTFANNSESPKIEFSADDGYSLTGTTEYTFSPIKASVTFGTSTYTLPTVVRLAPQVSYQSAALQFDGLAVEDGAVSLSFRVRTTAALDTPDWQPATVSGAAVSPDGKTVTLTIPATAAQGFYNLGIGD